jgi:hypothetical protein
MQSHRAQPLFAFGRLLAVANILLATPGAATGLALTVRALLALDPLDALAPAGLLAGSLLHAFAAMHLMAGTARDRLIAGPFQGWAIALLAVSLANASEIELSALSWWFLPVALLGGLQWLVLATRPLIDSGPDAVTRPHPFREVLGVLLGLGLLYVLSVGPAALVGGWRFDRGPVPTAYLPVAWLHHHTPLERPLEAYLSLWGVGD